MARILYADDNEDLRFHFNRIMPRIGVEGLSVDDASEAWRRLDGGEAFDALLSDLEMPIMNGLEFLRKVRGDSRFVRLPFMLISGRDKVNDRPLVDICKELNAVFAEKGDFSFYDLKKHLGL